MNGIAPIRPPLPVDPAQSIAPVSGASSPPSSSASSFASAMGDAMSAVQSLQSQSQLSAARFLAGESVDLHKVALDQQRAAISFDMFLQVRNKVVQAYQEVMRMQV